MILVYLLYLYLYDLVENFNDYVDNFSLVSMLREFRYGTSKPLETV